MKSEHHEHENCCLPETFLELPILLFLATSDPKLKKV